MNRHKLLIALALGAATILGAAPGALGARTLATAYRYAAQFDEWFIRGDADLSVSPAFQNGLRLAAWDGRQERDVSRVAAASAVYFFQVPADARTVAIEIGYKSAGLPGGGQIAGQLFVRDEEIERRFASQLPDKATPLEEPTFYGNTYLLPSDQVQLVVELPTANHVINGVLELHLSAGAGQALDVQYVQVTSLAEERPVYVSHVPSIRYVRDPYAYTYTYYYQGPWYYPRDGFFAGFYLFDNDIAPYYWGGWYAYRAAFHVHHPWRYRPDHYTNVYNFVYYPTYVTNIYLTDYRRRWYRRHYHVEIGDWSEQHIDRDFRRRVRWVRDGQLAEFRTRLRDVVDRLSDGSRRVRQGFGNRLADRLQAWRANPALARRELARWDAEGGTLQQAVAAWRAIPVEQRREAARTSLATLRKQASEKLQAWRQQRSASVANSRPAGFTGPSLTTRVQKFRERRQASSAAGPAPSQGASAQASKRPARTSNGRSALQQRIQSWRNRQPSTSASDPARGTASTATANTGRSVVRISGPSALRQRIQSIRQRQTPPAASATGAARSSTVSSRSGSGRLGSRTVVIAGRPTNDRLRGSVQSILERRVAAKTPSAPTSSLGSRIAKSGSDPAVIAGRSGRVSGLRSRVQSLRARRAASRAPSVSAGAASSPGEAGRLDSAASRATSNPVVIPRRSSRRTRQAATGANTSGLRSFGLDRAWRRIGR